MKKQSLITVGFVIIALAGAYLYFNGKKNSSNSILEGSSFYGVDGKYYIKNGKYYKDIQPHCITTPCNPVTMEINKEDYDSQKVILNSGGRIKK